MAKDEITVGELLDFIKALPDRRLVMKYPDGTQRLYPLGKFRNEIAQLDRRSYVFAPDLAHILQRAREKNGWLCMEYGCAFAHLARTILRDEKRVADDADARKVLNILRDIEARTEIEISCDEYSQLMSSAWLPIKDFLHSKTDSYPLYASLVRGIWQNYHTALSVWRQEAALQPMQFIGGGFGIEGAVMGMAAAYGLNAIAGAISQRQKGTLRQRMLTEWSFAAKKLRAAEKVMRIR